MISFPSSVSLFLFLQDDIPVKTGKLGTERKCDNIQTVKNL